MDWGDELALHVFLGARNGDALGHRTDSHACCRLLDLLAYVRRSESPRSGMAFGMDGGTRSFATVSAVASHRAAV